MPIESVSQSAEDQLADAEALRRSRRSRAGDRRVPMLDRLPPNSPESERGVLGCALLEPSYFHDVRAKLKTKDAFYDLRHQTIWETLCALQDAGTPIDLITVLNHLKDRQLLEQVGGAAYLSQLQDAVPSAANWSYYAEHVIEKSTLRRMINTCSGAVGKVYDYEGDVESLLGEVERDILAIRSSVMDGSDLVDISAVQQKVIKQYEDAFLGHQNFGLQTGFDGLDNIIGGMLEQELIMIGAAPSQGKTSLILNVIHRLALEKRIPVGIFSLDDPADTIIHRLACIDARVNGAEIRRGRPTEDDMTKLAVSMGKISAAKDCLMIDDSGGGSEHMMLAKARRMVQRGAKIIFVDYLQIIPAEGDGMYERTTNASHMVKRLAKEARVPVVCISAITKPAQAKADWHPTLQDFRGSGDIDYDVNQAWLLYRDPEDMENEFATTYRVVLDVGKNKQGPTGRTFLQFFKESTKFEQASNFAPVV